PAIATTLPLSGGSWQQGATRRETQETEETGGVGCAGGGSTNKTVQMVFRGRQRNTGATGRTMMRWLVRRGRAWTTIDETKAQGPLGAMGEIRGTRGKTQRNSISPF